jgi:hypothetical protein
VLLKPGHNVTGGRTDKSMTQVQPVLDAQRRALDMIAGTGANFACEAGVDSAGIVGRTRQIANARFVREVGVRLLEPIEVIGDREVLGYVALPGRYCATIGLGPIRHPELRDALALWPQQPLTADSLTQRRADLLKIIGAVPKSDLPDITADEIRVESAFGARPIRILTYRPVKSDNPLPTIVHVHGGGFAGSGCVGLASNLHFGRRS